MRNYQVFHEFDAEDCLIWNVYEKTTNQVVKSFWFEDDAVEYARFLDTGGGFNGFTPAFVIKKTHSFDINDAFAAEFME